jgi:hypothetical protein
MHLHDDKKHAEIEVRGAFDAAGIEALITDLARLRAGMEPPIPCSPPPREPEDVAAVRARGDPVVQVAVMRDGHTRFWVRHDGLGWFGFNLPVERASQLASVILEMTGHPDGHNELARLKRRESDLYH